MKIDCEIPDDEWSSFLLVVGMGMGVADTPTFRSHVRNALEVLNKLNGNNENYEPYKDFGQLKKEV
jgi:hypothetical protein